VAADAAAVVVVEVGSADFGVDGSDSPAWSGWLSSAWPVYLSFPPCEPEQLAWKSATLI
jgi:hypothetical protein